MTEAHLWTGGRILTGTRYAEALLVEDGRVVAVGPREAVVPLAPTGTERTDLAGRLVIPGLIDAHLHLSGIARRRVELDLSLVASAGALEEKVGRWAADHPRGPIVGWGWDPERWSDRRWPTLRNVDPASESRPAILYHASGHAALVSSAVLESIGIDAHREAPAVPGIGRYPDGRPNGLLYEEAMRPLGPIAASVTAIGPELFASTTSRLAAFGLTTIASMGTSLEEVAALRELGSAGRLPISVRAYVRAVDRKAVSPERANGAFPSFAIVGIKEFLDGAFGTRTAWLTEPYADAPPNVGLPVGDDRELAELLDETSRAGFAPALHAIGDRAVERAIRLLEPPTRRGFSPSRIEHAGLVPPSLLPRLETVRPTLVVQPGFVWSDGWLGDRLGPERARWAYPFRTLLERGLPLAGSSDAPFDPVDPWRGIRAAVRRRADDGRSANPEVEEGLSPEEAVGLYTAGAAAALGEPERGRLEAGAIADLVVLSTPDLASALAHPGVPADETWVAGRRVSEPPVGLEG